MTEPILTKDLLKKLNLDEFQIRNAVRAGHIKPSKFSNGLYFWTPEQVKQVRKFFKQRE